MKDWEKFFKEKNNFMFNVSFNEFDKFISLEELYQAFKERLEDEYTPEETVCVNPVPVAHFRAKYFDNERS